MDQKIALYRIDWLTLLDQFNDHHNMTPETDADTYIGALKKKLREIEDFVGHVDLENDYNQDEVLNMDSPELAELVKGFKGEVRKLKRKFSDRENHVYLMSRGNGGIIKDDENSGNREEMGLLRDKNMLMQARQNLNKGIDTAGNISQELVRNKETLMNSLNTTKVMAGDLDQSNYLVGALKDLRRRNACIYYGVVGSVVLFCVMYVYVKIL
jgi:hypothetical protein